MQEAIKKSQVLIEALPYIKAFHEKIVVIKYGGSAIIDRRKRRGVLEDIVFMSYAGMRPVLIHGGGPFINRRLRKLGIRSHFVKGLRITDEKTLNVIKEIMTRINKRIVKEIRQLGGKAQGFTTRNCVIRAKKNTRFGNIGYVGEIISINKLKIEEVIRKGVIPVISPIGIGRDGKRYNVNADQASAAIAVSLEAEKLALLTNVDGILRYRDKKDSLISTITASRIRRLIDKNIIDSGMIPKVKAGISALRKGVNKIHIINGGLTHALLLEIFTDEGIGTQIIK